MNLHSKNWKGIPFFFKCNFSIFEWKYLKSDHLVALHQKKGITIRLPDAFKRLEFSLPMQSVLVLLVIFCQKVDFKFSKNDFILRASRTRNQNKEELP